MGTNADWERWGQDNPYYGVLSDPQFLGKTLSKQARANFYMSGEGDIKHLADRLALLNAKKSFEHAVDFGCGVGRLSFPLTKLAAQVTGLDISPSMIALAKKQARIVKSKEVHFAVTDDTVAGLPEHYDLVYSYIVFQHIPPSQGYRVLRQLAENLTVQGCLAIQITFGLDRSRLQKTLIAIRQSVPPVRWIGNILRGRPLGTPNMRMHSYSLNAVFDILRQHNIHNCNVEFTDHGGFLGAFIAGIKE